MKGRLMDLIFPPRCVLCGHGLRGTSRLCPDCAAELRQCGRAQGARPVAGCADTDAALLYRGKVRRALIACKFQDKPALGAWGGGLVAACLLRHRPAWQPDLVTFVPTTLGHWWKRGFNLSHLLAREAARRCGLPCVRTLRRRWFARSQLSMQGDAARRQNAARAYFPGNHVQLAGKRVVLVDDILTSGATAAACAALLRQMGAAEVYFLCLAKTPSYAKK